MVSNRGDRVLSTAPHPAIVPERLTLTYAFSQKRKADLRARVNAVVK